MRQCSIFFLFKNDYKNFFNSQWDKIWIKFYPIVNCEKPCWHQGAANKASYSLIIYASKVLHNLIDVKEYIRWLGKFVWKPEKYYSNNAILEVFLPKIVLQIDLFSQKQTIFIISIILYKQTFIVSISSPLKLLGPRS